MSITATLIGQIITFAILVWFIGKYLWEPMTQMMDDRKKRIADGLAAAERGVHEQELAEQKVIERLKEAKEQAAEILALAQKRGAEIIEDAKDDAKAEGARLITAANAEIEQEVNRAKESLRAQVVDITLAAAGKIVKKEIDAKTHGDLLKDVVGQI
ncbi:MAG: F0F1 ATP synthase subunit B [gamma proteobacterium symbiont of Taylorina sp.]|nr:F0F1 ATP synthase subunit B [gamma proteobacterium symbiont of Taylorina sp.]